MYRWKDGQSVPGSSNVTTKTLFKSEREKLFFNERNEKKNSKI
jgi:hypothetical protein